LHKISSFGDVLEEFNGIGSQFSSVVVIVDLEQLGVLFDKILQGFDISIVLAFRIVERQIAEIIC
jgi:hypothetical protein